MILGIALILGGYAVFYWGLHHFPGVDCPDADPNSCRYSLWELLGVPSSWNVPGYPQVGPVRLTSTDTVTTQSQQPNNNTTSNNLSGGTGGAYQSAILSGLGAPVSVNNVSKLTAWNACEGNDPGKSGLGINNPFNTTLNCCGGQSVNSAGVKAYPTPAAGVSATLQTLQSSRYSAIINNLVSDGPRPGFASAVGSSGWGTSGSCIASKL